MEFMFLFLEERGAPRGGPAGFAAMKEYAGELARRGIQHRGAPLVDEPAGAQVRVRDGKALVTDGPFAETKEVLGGFWIIEAADRAQAIDIASRCPHAQYGIVEVHRMRERHSVRAIARPLRCTSRRFSPGRRAARVPATRNRRSDCSTPPLASAAYSDASSSIVTSPPPSASARP